jgi:hypothetical protein
MRHRHRSLVIAVLALALAPCIARAQDDPAKTAEANAALATLGRALSSPEIAPSLPVTPERRALVRQYLAEANVEASMKVFSQLFFSQSQAQVMAAAKGLSENQQSKISDAFTQAFNAAESAREVRLIDQVTTYYATRLTDDELKTVLDFYGSGIGYNMMHNPQAVTPEDRQKTGQYIMDHPALLKFTELNFAYMKIALARQQAGVSLFQADFKARFCSALAKDHLKMSTCLAS